VKMPLIVNSMYFCDADGKSDWVQSRKKQPVDETTPTVGTVRFERVTAKGCKACAAYVLGLPEKPMEHLILRDCSFDFDPNAEAQVPAMALHVEECCRRGLILKFVRKVTLDRVRYSCNQKDFKRYTTEETRKEFLIEKLFTPDTVEAVYSHVDRMVTLGIMPVQEKVSIDKGIDIWHNFGTEYFLERRECGMFNVGGAGKVTVDDTVYELGYKDCLYITRGAKKVLFESDDAAKPAKFYIVSAPAHCSYENKLIKIADAAKKPCGDAATSNKRVINQFIHPSVLKTCQLSMGMTVLDSGSVWNTMPAHTHERRMEVYFYFEVPKDNVVFHMMGEGQETRHIVMQNEQAVISPSWSIHAGAGTSNYTFIWAMGGENQEFDDMDTIPTTELR